MNSIQQIAVKMVEGIFKTLAEDGMHRIGEVVQRVRTITDAAALEIIETAIEELDAAVVSASRERRRDGLRIQERNVPRTIMTEMGELHYRRTYFETRDGEHGYLTDTLIGVAPYERLTKELCASLVQQAADTSMAKAVETVGVPVSRQTVNNRVLSLKQVVVEASRSEDTPKELHLFADEDHVHLQNGQSAMVPLLTVTEGVDCSARRHKTVNAVHFEGCGMSNEALFEGVSAFLHEKYNMELVDRIYLHGDGGRWMERAKATFPDLIRVMDGFHLQKRFRQLARLNNASAFMDAIYQSIRDNDVGRFSSCCASMRKYQDAKGRTVLAEQRRFLRNNWDAVVMRMQDGVCGSCTEPLVSHVLSKRLSRNPISWSEDGLRQMAMLRVYTQNGGVVSANDIRVSNRKSDRASDKASMNGGFARYRAYADRHLDEFLHKPRDWSIFESPPFRSGKLDGTHMLLSAFGRDHGVLRGA